MRFLHAAWLIVGLLCLSGVVHGGVPRQQLAEPAVVGTWEWELDVGPAGGKASMVVESVDGKLKATVTVPDGTVLEAKDIAVERDHVSFSVSRDMGFMKMVMSHTGKLAGDEILGTYSVKGGPMKKSGKWQAKRAKSK